MSLVRSLVFAAALLAAGCNTSNAPSETAREGWQGVDVDNPNDPDRLAAGKRIAEKQCATCHAIDKTSISAKPEAPPLREVLALYDDQDRLAYRLIEGMRVGHYDMPRFDMDVAAADALLAYIASLGK